MNACVHNLTWTHFRSLLRVPDEDARVWYMSEAAHENWNVRTLDRNISTQYYYRLLQAPKKNTVIAEMQRKTAQFSKTQFELVKSPVVAEFLGFKNEVFMSKYLTYLPTKEQLKQEIERQKAVFYMQHPIQIEEGGTRNEQT